MLAKWKKLSFKEQNQILVLIIFAIIGGSAFVYWQQDKLLFEAEKDLSRKQNRLKLQQKSISQPKASTAVLEKKLAKVAADVAKKKQRLVTLNKQLMPLNAPAQLQSLKRELANLADKVGLTIHKLELVGYGSDDHAPSLEQAQSYDNIYARPLINLEGKLTYSQLLNFVNQLKFLSYRVSPVKLVQLDAQVIDDISAEIAVNRQQYLIMQMQLVL